MPHSKKAEALQKVSLLSAKCVENTTIQPELYDELHVLRGLRDINGNGVLAGLTLISEIRQKKLVNGELVPCDGRLFYRGIDIREIIDGYSKEGRYGFEEVAYLLLFGKLPNSEEHNEFFNLLADYRQTIPKNFVRDVVMKAPSSDIMNNLTRSILTMYSYDKNANDISIPNVLRQCLEIIAFMPMLSVYAYNAYVHYLKHKSLYIHRPDPSLSTAENILHMLRPDSSYTELEARVLDTALVLHAEHGGGNNSSFTMHVVTSSGTDTYSAVAAALSSLKGPKHGGANIKVTEMFAELKKAVHDWQDDEEIAAYLTKLLDRSAYDRSGLIYGMGHAVYSISDPRAKIFKGYVAKLSAEKGCYDEFSLYSKVEEIAPKVIASKKRIYKGVSANVDFYSGLAYSMLGLPEELFTPIFAISRVAGWSAHRLEELINAGKIIRPAYKSVSAEQGYIQMVDRNIQE